ncbi:hypothetical protein [Flavobacterium sp. K5-23]|uniref:hypothetical protein n=1 Tax=Flavobacterium sp. K5-23 TaxID=2746225 RepID=UPI00200FF774|nr:hypothetical protein [Flavobacterium sp. K5-23]UQD56039.1 hypothetical protein FLAK523_06425 [Flavobacterium sp. K5-23]
MKKIFILFLVVAMSSCATKIDLPVSSIVPAAEGTVKVTKDKNKNYVVDLEVRHLANADRLNPAKAFYVVWIVSEDGQAKNIGKLVSGSSNKASLKSTTPFQPEQIFITAEDDGSISWPGGQEIFRTETFKVK